MHKDDLVYIDHIKESIERIKSYVIEITREEFEYNLLIQDAVIRNFEIIGEASKKISKDFKEAYPEIPWKDVAGMRDKLVHDYLGVDIDVIWEAINEDLPFLEEFISGLGSY
jgi:uncharacterized protein with HEPN domain